MSINLEKLSSDFAERAKALGIVLTTAESCTAGLISSTVAMTSGSSAWLDSGFVVYTPEAKHQMLGVKYQTIDKFNITSVQVASEMAMGALMRSGANLAIAVTGVAGPNGGTQEIPVGTVAIVFAARIRDTIKAKEKLCLFSGDRNEIREMVVQKSLVDCVDFFETFKNKMIGVN